MTINSDRPVIGETPLERVQTPVRYGHIMGVARMIQACQLKPQPLGVPGLNATPIARTEKSLNALVTKGTNHANKCIA